MRDFVDAQLHAYYVMTRERTCRMIVARLRVGRVTG
jgi:hypothetical protein